MTEIAVAPEPTSQPLPFDWKQATRPQHLALPEGLTLDEWAEAGPMVQRIASSSSWWFGDWLAYGEAHWSERYAQAVEVSGATADEIQKCLWVAHRFPPETRHPHLSFGVHHVVSFVEDPGERERWLEFAFAEGVGMRELRAAIKQATEASPGDPLPGTDVPQKVSVAWTRKPGHRVIFAIVDLDDAEDLDDADIAAALAEFAEGAGVHAEVEVKRP